MIDFKKYAQVMVGIGANVQKGQKVRLVGQVDQRELIEAVAEECYLAGAKHVELFWEDSKIEKLSYTYSDTDTLGTVLPWEEERAKQMVKDMPVMIYIESADPDALNGVSADVLSTVRRMRMSVLKKYREALDGKQQWLIVAAASPAWAKKVFPDMDEDAAVEKLWEAILKCMYIDGDTDPTEAWKKHVEDIQSRVNWLNQQNFVRLEYKSANGTDFRVGLIPGAKWCGAGDTNSVNGAFYVPNMPTEEVFTSPMRGDCEGKLVATKPLSWAGQLIEDFYVRYENGKVVECGAKNGGDALSKMLHIDEGAEMLGEVALVPKESPVNQSGILFLNTLFDENACCHFAAGNGFGEVFDDYIDISPEEMHARGVNDSIVHVDFMIGSDDLSIVGIRADGSRENIFVKGTWVR